MKPMSNQSLNACPSVPRLMYTTPLTPPSSDPGSPNQTLQVSAPGRHSRLETNAIALLPLQNSQRRITPPPPYNQPNQPHQQAHQSNIHPLTAANIHNGSSSGLLNGNSAPQNSRSTNSNASSSGANTSTAVRSLSVRYNRRNNPELEKRRIHHCDFLGKQC